MSTKIDPALPENKELIERITTRLMEQSKDELEHVLRQLFPNAPAMRIKAISEDFHEKRIMVINDFTEMMTSLDVNHEVFRALSSADADPNLPLSRKQFDPTKFEISLTCNRTPFKEFFDECKSITCESCIEGRMTKFLTNNDSSTQPWEVKIERVEQRRLDLCKNCGSFLGRNSNINLQNERLLYTCSYCGHKGWTKAK